MTDPIDSASLEPNPEAMEKMTASVSRRLVAHLGTLREQPIVDLAGGAALTRALSEPLPEGPEDLEPLLDLLFDRVIPTSIHTAHPGMLSYVQGGGLFHAALADFVSLAVNRYVAYSAAAPGLAALEATACRWFCDLVGYTEARSGGILTSGGSMATLMALVTARSEKLGEDLTGARLYASDQLHHAIPKAARIAGLRSDAVRLVPTDDTHRIDPVALREMIAADRRAGFRPFMIVGTAGTTSSGAVDDLAALGDVSRAENVWFHVDAAYGGFFLLTERGRAAMRGIDAADSVALDPHKSLFLPYGTGALVVRDLEALQRAHELHSDYVEGVRGETGLAPDAASVSPELTRDARGLRVWLPIKLVGAGALRAALDEKLDLARHAAARLRTMKGVEHVTEPSLSTVAFFVDRRIEDQLVDRVNALGRTHLSGTVLRGRAATRICVLSFRTHAVDVGNALDDIERVLRA